MCIIFGILYPSSENVVIIHLGELEQTIRDRKVFWNDKITKTFVPQSFFRAVTYLDDYEVSQPSDEIMKKVLLNA